MVLTRLLTKSRSNSFKVNSWEDRRNWIIFIAACTAAPIYCLFHLFTAGGAAAADAAVSGKMNKNRLLTELAELEPEKSTKNRMTIL